MKITKVEKTLQLYNKIIELNKQLDNEVSELNLNEFTEFQSLKKYLKTYVSKWIR